MENGLIEKAIEEFRNKRLTVYKADPDQIVRDARGAERASRDHVGRWLFELLQNSDDACSSEVKIVLTEDTLYVADNGNGLKPSAVSAISGTDFSDKTTGTIGRKGVGFKSVYQVSQNPQALTVFGEGIEFSIEKTREWLQQNNLNSTYLPYQWIPFLIDWDEALRNDPLLKSLSNYKTIIRLPCLSLERKKETEELLRNWPPHSLFTFRHLRRITAPDLEIALSEGDGVWFLNDSRGNTAVEWRAVNLIERVSQELLQVLGEDERRAVAADGVSFLIAAPFENGCVVPTHQYLPVHVFYPTEQKGPVRLLLHAEFLVKSDRTALVPIEGSPFNQWVADKLSDYVFEFVNSAFSQQAPSKHVSLLLPFPARESHFVAAYLWKRIADKAKNCLRLTDVECCQRLSLEEARLISVNVRADLARALLEATNLRSQLLHRAFDKDEEARKALRELRCKEIRDENLLEVITANAQSLAGNREWVWTCWQWLAEWVAKEPYRDEHAKLIGRIKALPILPVQSSLKRPAELAAHIVTWKPDAGVDNLPDWLPLTFVDDWFRDRIQAEDPQKAPLKNLCQELGIKEPGTDVIQRAVGRAIEQYWKDKQGDPGRFLRFILEQDWHETTAPSESFKRCPVPLTQPVEGELWAEAGKAYFGHEWGNELLARLYDGIGGVAWVANDRISTTPADKLPRALEWLGVAKFPRVVDDANGQTQEIQRVVQALTYYTALDPVPPPKTLEHIDVTCLPSERAVVLLRLLSKYWSDYYKEYSSISIGYRYYRRYSASMASAWWNQVKRKLCLPLRGSDYKAPLNLCWLPDKRTERVIGDLLPVIDMDAFENDKEVVSNWLINTVDMRTRIEQLTIEEWKTLLSKRIPEIAPAEKLLSEERIRDKVTGWYEACLETVAEKENIPEEIFASCPIMCSKGEAWKYFTGEPRYLNDDNDLGKAFTEDVWLFHIPARLTDQAVKYFGVLRLSRSVKVNVTPGEPQSKISEELYEKFIVSLPYVYAWRASQSKEHAETLVDKLKGLEVLVAHTLKASLLLNGFHHEIERPWSVETHRIYLHKDHANEAELAQALAKALNVTSEADFYENLLRCTGDHERKSKLVSKGMADAEIDRYLREYSAPPDKEDYTESPVRPPNGEQSGSTSQTPSGGDTQGQEHKQPPAARSGETFLGSSSGSLSSGSIESVKQPLRLKDPSTTPYVTGSPPSGGAGTVGSGEDGGSEREGRSLTDAEKAELEEAGRVLAVRKLKGMGFTVEKMPQGNPGFDLRAKKDGDELRVEVKAHIGRATVVELTHREYIEYLRQQGYRWQLWNVEHLAEDDPKTVVITRYDQIPDDALDARTFRVDLKKCQLKLQDEVR